MTFFVHDGLSFRLPSMEDLPAIAELRNDPSTWCQLTDPLPVTPRDQKAWLESLSLRNGRFYAAAFSGQHPFIGLVRMDERDSQNRSIRVGLDVVPKLRGLGYGTSIYQAVLAYAFDQLNCHRVWLQVLQTNKRGARLYEKLGFKTEGILREAVFRDGRYVDYTVMSILEGERP